MAGERSVASVLQRIVEGLGQQPHVALTRIWLRGPADLCASCRMRRECPDQRSCLHLVASAGQPIHAVSEDWSRLSGAFRQCKLQGSQTEPAVATVFGLPGDPYQTLLLLRVGLRTFPATCCATASSRPVIETARRMTSAAATVMTAG